MKIPKKLKREARKQLRAAKKENPALNSSSVKNSRKGPISHRQKVVMTFPYKAGDLVILRNDSRRSRERTSNDFQYVTIVEVLQEGQSFSVMTNVGTLIRVSGKYLSPA